MEHTTNVPPKAYVGRPSQQMISETITEFEDSQFSVEEYCEYKGLNRDTFESWLNKHRNRTKELPAFVSVNLKEDEVLAAELFAEYKGLKFYQPMDAAFFKALIS
jgi:hypothetical protein